MSTRIELKDRAVLSVHRRLPQYRWGIPLLRFIRGSAARLLPFTPLPGSELVSTGEHVPVSIGESTVPGAGQGLFATNEIVAGTRIGEYTGEIVDSAWHWLRLPNKDYLMTTAETNVFVDAARQPQALMRYVNDHFDPSKINSCRVAEGRRVYYHATRNIAAGEELFVSYGELYWRLRGKSVRSSGTRPGG
jgi:hypothetical protein